ncbi:aminotransferase class V-fold PLP-dependent enzyme [Rhodopila sp.]|jgi:selenocysteine lyase/cysteine desulfurase|uniref:aminotransferase class V-fold PLP-dependent enzyme n=1 Tax=Rhodopila sp. TaxID=2480087 RepID=UPI002D0375AB|nr:aminotransferase class V-fold PLP-dependent enzyme [Rhodopila sp.]HVZ06463.1 aminotransferase class V-fold PLP-dependent enzyme [Rhodopila sp.]
MPALFNPADFRLPTGVTHVCAGGETAALRSHDAAMLRYLADKSAGFPGRTNQEAEVEAARAGIARLWHVRPEDIGFVSNVAEGVSIVAESLDWREGDAIAIDAVEYPSVVGPIALRRHPPVRLIQARGSDPDRLVQVAGPGTRIIAASYVSYLTGERVDLHALRRAADRIGALLVVDFTQASGYLPIEASLADFAFSACYKWMLGITGVAIAYWNRTRQPDWAPASAGWHAFAPGGRGYDVLPPLKSDAMRFTRGNPAHCPIYVLNNALSYLHRYDPATVQRHVQGLTTALLGQLHDLQIPTTTPADPARHGASVCIPSVRAAELEETLRARGVFTWNGQGRVRISFHGYNDAADVDRIVAALRACGPV